jgi:Tfp pilus assembly protein PilO
VGAPRIKTLPFGLTGVEIVAAFITLACVAIALTYYWTSLRPEQARLRQLERQLEEQQRDLVPITPGVASTVSPSDAARDALESLERFKTVHLRAMRSGEIQLLRDLNAMAKKNGVQLTSGIDTTPRMPGQIEEDTSGAKKTQKQRKPEEILNMFPTLAARLSVAGEYTNLRSFISELESSKQFLVVKTISIINQEGKTTGRNRRSEATGGLVLSIEMTAYFHP